MIDFWTFSGGQNWHCQHSNSIMLPRALKSLKLSSQINYLSEPKSKKPFANEQTYTHWCPQWVSWLFNLPLIRKTYCYQKQKGILPKTQIGLINQPWGKVAEQRSGLEAKSQGIKHASKAILFTAIPIGILHKKLPTIRIHTYIYSAIVPYRQNTQSFEASTVLQYFHLIGESSLLYVTNLHGGSRDGYENWGWRGIFLAT